MKLSDIVTEAIQLVETLKVTVQHIFREGNLLVDAQSYGPDCCKY